MQGSTRRELMAAIAAAASGAAGLEAQHQHATELLQIPAAGYKPQVLSGAEMAWVGKLADAIIPRTDTPGASDAGVPDFIDRRLSEDAGLAQRFRHGMALLDAEARKRFGTGFESLEPARARDLLTPVSTADDTDLGRFFRMVKDLTIDGYYRSHEGLVQELGWHGNTFLAEFPGCKHPEHQS